LFKDIKTRWDSTYEFLKRLLEYRAVIGALSTGTYDAFDDELEETVTYKLPALNFGTLQNLITALEPFAEYTKQLSARDASIAEILPIYYAVKAMSRSTTSQVTKDAVNGLIDRMAEMENSM